MKPAHKPASCRFLRFVESMPLYKYPPGKKCRAGILPNAEKPLESPVRDCYIITVHRTHSEQETPMKIKSISKAVLLLALLTSTALLRVRMSMLSSAKAIAALILRRNKGIRLRYIYLLCQKRQKVHVSISNEGADTYLFGPGSMIQLIYPDIHQNSIVTDNITPCFWQI